MCNHHRLVSRDQGCAIITASCAEIKNVQSSPPREPRSSMGNHHRLVSRDQGCAIITASCAEIKYGKSSVEGLTYIRRIQIKRYQKLLCLFKVCALAKDGYYIKK
ncbi:hypothetical protein DPMN_128333 [Dreissena polymorpha]|uniref:Uncharacterized protein n=1 Tax=Dreissena polymorpha TaxID=45954 RepID=A0A9D4K012_DREPO|nr:hypothetical protein DPMN_128333 [Dreissena polymorpha]